MKKIFVLFLTLCMMFSLVACGSELASDVTPNDVSTQVLETSVPTKQFEEVVVADTDDLTFIIKGTQTDNMWGTWDIKVFVENKTDKTLMFTWEDVSVNGYMIDPFWGTEVSAGKKENTAVSFFVSNFEENDISTVEEIEFTLWVYYSDEETWDMTDYLKETFTVTFN